MRYVTYGTRVHGMPVVRATHGLILGNEIANVSWHPMKNRVIYSTVVALLLYSVKAVMLLKQFGNSTCDLFFIFAQQIRPKGNKSKLYKIPDKITHKSTNILTIIRLTSF